MRTDQDERDVEVSEAVTRAFGREPSSTLDLFKQAGFCDEDAATGAKLMESGAYFGFEDAATSMGIFDPSAFRRRNPGVSPERIRKVAEAAEGSLDESGRAKLLAEAVLKDNPILAKSIAADIRADR